jgi:ADP-ribose pyrophosphatase YjhB (NUDIX family)
VTYRVPADDSRERAICGSCQHIDYENPLNVVGTVPVWEDSVLLCRRNIEPRHGFWTLPAGFMELGESTEAGAVRETDEEAGARIVVEGLFTVLNVVRVGQVHFFYRARLEDTRFAPGPETIEARLFREDEIPWDDLAFRTVKLTLERYFADRRAGSFGIHCVDIS